MIKAKFIRGVKSNLGSLIFTIPSTNGKVEEITLPARSGVGGSFNNTSWTQGKSPIPRSSEVGGKKLYLWLDPTLIKQPGQLPNNGKAIGEFWCISNSKIQSRFIYSISDKASRDSIGIHLDNNRVWHPALRKLIELFGFSGSAGCVVLQADSEEAMAKVLRVRNALFLAWKAGQTHIELEVV